jgi:alkylhydroperoxidase/carboxymuconolactone decarboxylase family protein YurZ
MDERVSSLITIGASAAVNCRPCLQYWLVQCERLGTSRDEIKAAIEIGLKVNRGAVGQTQTFIETLFNEGQSDVQQDQRGCGCNV